jgi:asparagine synthase (glutamine-hydrolysing)
MLKKLNGIFAFAIFDKKTSELFLARDGLGVKPLYIGETNKGILYSSELKALLCCPDLSKELDPQSLNRYLTFIWCPSPGTMFKKVKKLEPGHACIIKQGKIIKKWEWYNLPYDGKRLEGTEDEIAAMLTQHLEKAVERQLVADVPVGAFLSGGLDSSSIVAMMRKLHPDQRFKCYSIGFEDGEDVEGCPADLPYAELAAKHLHVDLEKITVTPDQLIERLAELMWFLDEPQADPAPVNAMFIAEKARNDGIKVLLSGAGGDDIFTGYRRHVAISTEKYWNWMSPKALKKLHSLSLKIGDVRNPWVRRIRKLLENAYLPFEDRLIGYFKWSSDETRAGLLNPELFANNPLEAPELPLKQSLLTISDEKDPINQMLYLDSKFFLVDHNLNYSDKTCMRYGVEARVPFLDPDLVKFAAAIPTGMKQKGKIGKAIFKKAMEPYLPHNLIYRPKTGFGAPLRKWIRNDLKDLIAQLLSESALKKRGLFNPKAVKTLIDDDLNGRIDGGYTILSILCIEIWCQLFLDGISYTDIKI